MSGLLAPNEVDVDAIPRPSETRQVRVAAAGEPHFSDMIESA